MQTENSPITLSGSVIASNLLGAALTEGVQAGGSQRK